MILKFLLELTSTMSYPIPSDVCLGNTACGQDKRDRGAIRQSKDFFAAFVALLLKGKLEDKILSSVNDHAATFRRWTYPLRQPSAKPDRPSLSRSPFSGSTPIAI